MTLLNKILNIDELIKEFNRKQKNNEKFSQEQFEIMCYSLRFILQSAQSKNNNFYNNLLTPQCKEYISNNFIPGTLPYNNIVINSYYILNELLRIPQHPTEKTGFYVCTCGQYYTLGNCTCPNGKFPCKNVNYK